MTVKDNPTTTITTTFHKNRVAFIYSCWHSDIVNQCRDAFLSEFNKLTDLPVDLFDVPGAFEIPLHAKQLAHSGKYSAIVAAGLVTDGGIYKHEFVAQAVISGLMQVQLDTNTPVLSAVLTPHHFHNSDEHQQFFSQHFVTKGIEAANACADTLKKREGLFDTP